MRVEYQYSLSADNIHQNYCLKNNLPVPWFIIRLSFLLGSRGGSHIGVDADGGPGGEGVGERSSPVNNPH
ncbi:uncharacterized protein METZ01_LOCUS309975 [marine metagenome]|uniref:Uncharacterized protein n=1 Tax=marine metagenome TaxID=408172 RepID=A0A382NC21_9ZZZZ